MGRCRLADGDELMLELQYGARCLHSNLFSGSVAYR